MLLRSCATIAARWTTGSRGKADADEPAEVVGERSGGIPPRMRNPAGSRKLELTPVRTLEVTPVADLELPPGRSLEVTPVPF